MKESDELFRLVRSLSKPEKRYVTLSISIEKGEKNYMKLFRALAKMDVYDGESLRRSFSGTGMARYLPAVKSYLYRLLLECLGTYHSSASVSNRLRWDLI